MESTSFKPWDISQGTQSLTRLGFQMESVQKVPLAGTLEGIQGIQAAEGNKGDAQVRLVQYRFADPMAALLAGAKLQESGALAGTVKWGTIGRSVVAVYLTGGDEQLAQHVVQELLQYEPIPQPETPQS